MEVAFEGWSKKQPEINQMKKSEEDYSRLFDRKICNQGRQVGLRDHTKVSGFFVYEQWETC